MPARIECALSQAHSHAVYVGQQVSHTDSDRFIASVSRVAPRAAFQAILFRKQHASPQVAIQKPSPPEFMIACRMSMILPMPH